MIDNRTNPTKATCIPGCPAVVENPGLGLMEFQDYLHKQHGWLWHVDYEQVCAHCPDHPFTGEHPDPGQYD